MNKVKVLIEGYAKVNSDGTWDATSTTTLIETGKHKIIMDPGCHRQLLLDALAKEGLKTEDIDTVFISHHHPDHDFLMGVFENAIVIDSHQWQKDSHAGDHQYTKLPDTDIKIIKTPGHTLDHASLLIPTAEGEVLAGADIWWWSEEETQTPDINKTDEFAADVSALKLSRSHALKIADYIIPGHGKIFKVK